MPPEVVAPAPPSFPGIVIVNVVPVGVDVTINFLSQKSAAPKFEPVIALKVVVSPNKIISPGSKLCADGKVRVTVGDPLLVLKAFVRAVPDGLVKGCIS
jgi:hypothetical protein